MFGTIETKKKLAALEQESELLKNELSQQAGIINAALKLLSAFESEEALDIEERLHAAHEYLRRLDQNCGDRNETPDPDEPLVRRIENRLVSYIRIVEDAARKSAQIERLAEFLETALETLSEDALKGMVKSFPVYDHWEEAGGKAWVTTAFCQLGGCEYRGREFDTYREALAFAIVREALGKEVQTSGACPECYAEYMADCV